MTAQPVHDCDPEDPVKILRALPAMYRKPFLAEYDLAIADARHPERYRELRHLLRLWRLRAVAYSAPGYEARLCAAQESVRTGRSGGTPVEEIVPDWEERVTAAERRQEDA
jgi:Family of unknown function (DUF6247)